MRKNTTDAIENIPIRLIMSIALIAAITLLVGISFQSFTLISAEHQIQQECKTVESMLHSMIGDGYARDIYEKFGVEGTKRSMTLSLPKTLEYLSFGVDPDHDNDGVLSTGLTGQGSVIVYRVSSGSKHIIWLEDTYKFREGIFINKTWKINGDGQGYIITQAGKISITFELVMVDHERYILIQATDDINP